MRKNGRNHGQVFTNLSIVDYLLDEVGYCANKDLRDISILEPAAGSGAFATAIVKRLLLSSKSFSFSFSDAFHKNIRLVECDTDAFGKLKQEIAEQVSRITNGALADMETVCIQADFLSLEAQDKFNCIVGNPPYVRHERISEENKSTYRKQFITFKHRADLYVPFFERALAQLKPGGILSFICSNRWLTNQYGHGLRELIATKYHLDKLANIEKTSPFDEAVIAYPAITTISNTHSKKVTYFAETAEKELDLFKLQFKAIPTPKGADWNPFLLQYDLSVDVLAGVEEQGFKIGIGVATGNDGVFVKGGHELNGIEKSRVLPLVKSSDLKNGQFKWNGHYVLNPYEDDVLCDLDKYPHFQNYLMENKDVLLERHVARKNPDRWYKTIDKITPGLQYIHKLLLPDLTSNQFLFIDEGKYYPHHNLYYISGGAGLKDLKILASFLMSDFVKRQMFKLGIRMNGGLPRFQSQLLRKLKVPRIQLLSPVAQRDMIAAYDSKDLPVINQLIDSFCQSHQVDF